MRPAEQRCLLEYAIFGHSVVQFNRRRKVTRLRTGRRFVFINGCVGIGFRTDTSTVIAKAKIRNEIVLFLFPFVDRCARRQSSLKLRWRRIFNRLAFVELMETCPVRSFNGARSETQTHLIWLPSKRKRTQICELNCLKTNLLKIVFQKLQPTICLEIGCGSGVVSTFLSKHLNEIQRKAIVFSTDINPRALTVTVRNASENGADVNCVQTNLVDALKQRLNGKFIF